MTAPVAFPSEAVFQSAVIKAAKALGCMVYHPSNPMRDARGFPDLVIVGSRRTIFRELKTERGRVRPEQDEWIARLARSGADVAIWRPADWPHHITQQLKEIR